MKPLPSILKRKEDKRAKAADRIVVYRFVYKRDGYQCRACGDVVSPGSLDSFKRAHPHHVQFRSRGGQDVPENLATLCPICHDLIHAYRLHVAGNANGALTFSTEGRTPWVSWPACSVVTKR